MNDHNEALRLAGELAKWARDYATTDFTDDMATKAAALLRQQAERITELEKMQDESSDVEASLRAQIAGLTAERDQLRAEVETLKVALRMGAEAEVARAHEVVGLRAEAERLRSAVRAFCDATSWSAQSWKDQPYIKPLFDLARTTHKDEG